MLRMKAKNFNEINQQPASTEQDSGDSNLSSISPDTSQSVTQFIIINQVVENFFEKYRDRVDANILNDITQQISVSFTSIAGRLLASPDHEDAKIQEIVQNFQQMIPADLWPHFAVADVVQLIQNLIASFQLGDKHQGHDEEELNKNILPDKYTPEELVKSILEDTFDSITGNDANNAQVLLTESMKNLIVTMSVEDIQRPECVQQLVQSIQDVARTSIGTLNLELVLAKVMALGEENYADDFNVDVLRDLISTIVDGLVQKLEE